MSLRMMRSAGVRTGDGVIDVGGGAAPLVDELLGQGFTDLTVLDVSRVGMSYAQRRLGDTARRVTWVVADVLTWRPPRRYDLWHDRAVFHFLTDADDQRRYVDTLRAAVAPGGHLVIGTFAADGPTRCSGLAVARYGPEGLGERLGPGITVIAADREEHRTPSGTVQPFTWVLARRGRAG